MMTNKGNKRWLAVDQQVHGLLVVGWMVLCLAFGLSSVSPCYAQDNTEESLGKSLSGQAAQAYQSGRDLFRHQDYQSAAIEFRRAFRLSKDPRLLWNIAACENKAHRYAEAYEVLQRYTESSDSRIDSGQKERAQKIMSSIRQWVIMVKLVIQPAGASVVVDGQPRGQSPLKRALLLNIGTHTIVVNKQGFKAKSLALQAEGGDSLVRRFVLQKEVTTGQLSIEAGEGSLISVDGRMMGTGAWSGHLPAGRHAIKIVYKQRDLAPHEEVIVLAAKAHRSLSLKPPQSQTKGFPLWGWFAIGGAVVIGGATTTYLLLRKSDASPITPTPGSLEPGVVTSSRSLVRW
jgi:hypothetical protein